MIHEVTNASPATASASNALGQLGSDAFLKLLVAQLKYQNPMDPSDGTEMLNQTAQFTQVETLQSLSKTQDQLMSIAQFSLAVGLSGQQVTAIGSEGRVTGTVESVRFTADGPLVQVAGEWLPMTAVVEVTPPDVP